MATILSIGGCLLLAITFWKHLMVVRFFRRPLPPPGHAPTLVSILQPILSGDPALPATLAHNLALAASVPLEFVWMVDTDDLLAQAICRAIIAAQPVRTIHLLMLPPAPQGFNPKTFKLVAGLDAAHGDVICVLDDDTLLTENWPEQCLPFLQRPSIGLVFGLPYQINFSNRWSSLVAFFVNSNSLLTYVPYAMLHDPVTINGMFYVAERKVLDAVGGFRGLEPILADDFAVAARFREHGYRLAQAPLRHAISTQVRSARHYLSLLQRWFIFPRESLLRHLPWREQMLVYCLAMLPAFAPLLLLCGLFIWPSPLPIAVTIVYLVYHYAIFAHFNIVYLRRCSPWPTSWLVPVIQVIFPLQLLAALLLPQRITWRGHVMQVERGGGFRFIRRREE